MQKSEDRIFEKCRDVSSLFSAGGNRGPETFVPYIACVASSALCHNSVHDQRTNVLFGLIVRLGNQRFINK